MQANDIYLMEKEEERGGADLPSLREQRYQRHFYILVAGRGCVVVVDDSVKMLERTYVYEEERLLKQSL